MPIAAESGILGSKFSNLLADPTVRLSLVNGSAIISGEYDLAAKILDFGIAV
jgi:hypothetical protein